MVIITHDTGRHLGCYGRGADTPNLDALAEQGVKFNQAFCTAPQCSPSRASFLTGLMPHRHGLIGLTHRGFRLNPNVPLLPKLLSQAGYFTYLFGLQHEATDASELGYQTIPSVKSRSCLDVTPILLEFLADSPPQPFFVSVGFSETHRVFPKVEADLDKVKVPPFLPDTPEIRQDIAELNESVRRVDICVGAIVKALKQHRLSNNTLVIFMTDHGIAFPGAKATLFDPGIEVALLMLGPDEFSGGKVVNAMVSNADLMPTILELLGVDVPDGIDGRSILPLVQGKVDKLHDTIFVEQTYHAAYDPMRGVRTERFKYIRSFATRPFWLPPNIDPSPTKDWFREHQPEVYREPRPMELLYDLNADPMERNNLAGHPDYAPALNELRERMERRMRETNDLLLKGDVLPPKGARVTSAKVWGPEEGVTENYDPRTDEWMP